MVQQHTARAEWNRRRTRHDPPDIHEAIVAAQGLTASIDDQIEIAAQLMGLPEDQVRPMVLEAATRARPLQAPPASLRPSSGRTVLVERRSLGVRPPIGRHR